VRVFRLRFIAAGPLIMFAMCLRQESHEPETDSLGTGKAI
jgi:hypothetical protein